MKKKNSLTKKLTKIAFVIGAEILLFSGCLVMIYARGTGESGNHEAYQNETTEEARLTEDGTGKKSILQAGTNQDKDITSGIQNQNTSGQNQNTSEQNQNISESSSNEASAAVSADASANTGFPSRFGNTISDQNSEYGKVTEVQSETQEETEAAQQELYVEPISQLPELPTGCEITSLTMALNYAGYNADKEDLADNYLTKGRPGVNSYEEAFLGNPREEDSYGCFAPVIVRTANKYLTQQNSEKYAYDLTGTELEDLFDEIRQGNPVIVWGSMSINVDIEYTEEWNIDGQLLRWPGNEHCMVLCGFDLYNETVTVCDPLRAVETYDMESFERHYKQMEEMAVVIK